MATVIAVGGSTIVFPVIEQIASATNESCSILVREEARPRFGRPPPRPTARLASSCVPPVVEVLALAEPVLAPLLPPRALTAGQRAIQLPAVTTEVQPKVLAADAAVALEEFHPCGAC